MHAKCLRSLPLVRDYFREYRAKKRGGRSAASRVSGVALRRARSRPSTAVVVPAPSARHATPRHPTQASKQQPSSAAAALQATQCLAGDDESEQGEEEGQDDTAHGAEHDGAGLAGGGITGWKAAAVAVARVMAAAEADSASKDVYDHQDEALGGAGGRARSAGGSGGSSSHHHHKQACSNSGGAAAHQRVTHAAAKPATRRAHAAARRSTAAAVTSAASAWPNAHSAGEVSMQHQQHLLSSYMHVQAQHAAAFQQQLALAALADQFAEQQKRKQQLTPREGGGDAVPQPDHAATAEPPHHQPQDKTPARSGTQSLLASSEARSMPSFPHLHHGLHHHHAHPDTGDHAHAHAHAQQSHHAHAPLDYHHHAHPQHRSLLPSGSASPSPLHDCGAPHPPPLQQPPPHHAISPLRAIHVTPRPATLNLQQPHALAFGPGPAGSAAAAHMPSALRLGGALPPGGAPLTLTTHAPQHPPAHHGTPSQQQQHAAYQTPSSVSNTGWAAAAATHSAAAVEQQHAAPHRLAMGQVALPQHAEHASQQVPPVTPASHFPPDHDMQLLAAAGGAASPSSHLPCDGPAYHHHHLHHHQLPGQHLHPHHAAHLPHLPHHPKHELPLPQQAHASRGPHSGSAGTAHSNQSSPSHLVLTVLPAAHPDHPPALHPPAHHQPPGQALAQPRRKRNALSMMHPDDAPAHHAHHPATPLTHHPAGHFGQEHLGQRPHPHQMQHPHLQMQQQQQQHLLAELGGALADGAAVREVAVPPPDDSILHDLYAPACLTSAHDAAPPSLARAGAGGGGHAGTVELLVPPPDDVAALPSDGGGLLSELQQQHHHHPGLASVSPALPALSQLHHHHHHHHSHPHMPFLDDHMYDDQDHHHGQQEHGDMADAHHGHARHFGNARASQPGLGPVRPAVSSSAGVAPPTPLPLSPDGGAPLGAGAGIAYLPPPHATPLSFGSHGGSGSGWDSDVAAGLPVLAHHHHDHHHHHDVDVAMLHHHHQGLSPPRHEPALWEPLTQHKPQQHGHGEHAAGGAESELLG